MMNNKIFVDVIIKATHTIVWKIIIFYPCDSHFFLFRQPNLGPLASDLAEVWHTHQKLILIYERLSLRRLTLKIWGQRN